MLARERMNLSIAEAAKSLGVSECSVVKWEAGHRSPNCKYLPSIEEAYKFDSVKDIFADV